MLRSLLSAALLFVSLSFQSQARADYGTVITNILCGLGNGCHQSSEAPIIPDPSNSYKGILYSPMGLSIQKFFNDGQWFAFKNALMNRELKLNSTFEWGGSYLLESDGPLYYSGGKFAVVKFGVEKNDRRMSCFQYTNNLFVLRNSKVIARENYTGSACYMTNLPYKIYYETEGTRIDWN